MTPPMRRHDEARTVSYRHQPAAKRSLASSGSPSPNPQEVERAGHALGVTGLFQFTRSTLAAHLSQTVITVSEESQGRKTTMSIVSAICKQRDTAPLSQ